MDLKPRMSSIPNELATERLADRFLSVMLVFEIVLVIVTWPLWMSIDQFPAVPLLASLAGIPVWVDQLCALLLCLSAGVSAVLVLRESSHTSSPIARRSLWITVICGGILCLLNQHRLQPWHWLFLLLSLQTLLLRRDSRLPAFRLTIATIYLFAAASRWGPDVATGMSRQILAVAMNACGLSQLMKNATFVFAACCTMTAVEFLTGVFLLVPRLRRLGVAISIALHLVLILALSPIGLNHHAGVLVWNAFLLIGVFILFWPRFDWVQIRDSRTSVGALRWSQLFIILFPLSAYVGWADNWPAWQVYSPRPEIVRVFIHEDAVSQVPDDLAVFLGQPAPLNVWHPLRIDRWALATTGVPLYPEDRFQLAVAAKLMARFANAGDVQVLLDNSASRRQSKANTNRLDAELLRASLEGFTFNAETSRTGSW